jgi:hypothetical protein
MSLHLSASFIARDADMARLAAQKRQPHAAVTNSDDLGGKWLISWDSGALSP